MPIWGVDADLSPGADLSISDILQYNYYFYSFTYFYMTGAEFFSECISLVKEHKLFTEALELYSPVSQHYKVRLYLCIGIYWNILGSKY